MGDAQTNSYDRMLDSHATIRRWARQRGGKPVVIDSEGAERPRLGIEFPGETIAGDATRIEWDEFFTHFEAMGLAFACSEGTRDGDIAAQFELFDRNRIDEDASSEPSDAEAVQFEARADADAHDAMLDVERTSEIREREANAEANPDSHRDESPFVN